jgi:uncharacterized membrane protein YhaH (DUF805 family)
MNWRTFFSFRGRLNRARYWLALFIIMVGETILGFIESASSLSSPAGILIDLLVAIGEVAAVAASLAITVKRLHDRDKSAWWLLALYLAPALLTGLAVYLGIIANTSVGAGADYAALLSRVCLFGVVAFVVWFFVELGCRRGSVGTNRSGPDPLSPIRPWRTGLTGIDR